tara:strand:- start:809 stop:2044 length:1236 start_codon:yes stop_codon:yes gene_type:complete
MKRYLTFFLLTTALLFTGCGDSEDFVFTNTNVGSAPVAVNDAYTTNQDTTLTVNSVNGVLANDTPNGGTVTSFDATSTQNGTVNVNGNGSFTYTPPSSYVGPDTFTYTVTNNRGSSSATVTITVQAVNGYFVDAVNGNDGTGSFNGGLPFQSIQAAVAAAPTNADIVVLPGNYTGGVNLKDGQRLLGSGSTLVSPQGATRPQLTGPVVLADDNTLDFLRIEGTNGSAVDGIGQDSGTVTHCEIVNITGGVMVAGIAGDNTRGTWTISDNTFTNGSGAGVVFFTSNTDVGTFFINNNTMSNNGLSAIIFVSEDDSQIRAQLHGNTFQGNNTVTGDAFEIEVRDDSYAGLDLEDTINDGGIYSLFVTLSGNGELEIEQYNELTQPKPTGAGNTGTVDPTGKAPTPIPNGTLFP